MYLSISHNLWQRTFKSAILWKGRRLLPGPKDHRTGPLPHGLWGTAAGVFRDRCVRARAPPIALALPNRCCGFASGFGQRPTRKPLRSRSGAEPGRGVAGGRCVAPSSRSRFFRAASKSRALAPLNIPTAPYRVANRACLAPGHQRKQAAATGAGQLAISITARQGPTIGMTVGHMTIAATNIAARLLLLLRAQHPSA